jgi:homoserine kinase
VDLWNEVTAAPADGSAAIAMSGHALGQTSENLVLRAASLLAERCGRPLPAMHLTCVNRVPPSRGLGSSAAAIVSGVLLANRALGEPLALPDLLKLAVEIEGHADNVTPCLMGGIQVSVNLPQRDVIHQQVPLAREPRAVAFVPNLRLGTHEARAALPDSVPFADAVFNVARASLLVAALASGRLHDLQEATRDRLHQPYRAPLFPSGLRLIDAALDAGAYGAFVSGAGPTILALCENEDTAVEAVARAFEQAAAADRVDGEAMVLSISLRGAYVHDVD